MVSVRNSLQVIPLYRDAPHPEDPPGPPGDGVNLEAGEDLFITSRVLGHTSVATTASFDEQVQRAMLRRSADRMDEVIRKASGA